MAPVSLARQLQSAAGLGGLSRVPASTGSDAAAHAKYRPDIDGLRAVAVLPVLFYHLGISLTPGGFVGVDIFFVISGYLITSLISAEMHEGTYSIRSFYVRRARRIFPALFFMCAVTALFVLLFCLPSDAKRFSSSLAAATLFGSNIYFYLTADYFAAAAETQPLLHTWSLAVEEQFYIVFPLILLLVRRYLGQRERQSMTVLALLSLGLSIWLVRTDQAGAFYLLHSRAWELLLGALLALGTFPAIHSRLLAGAFGILGLALIAGSVLLYREAMPFPGMAALVPCIGAALLIHTGKDASLLSARALSLAPVRFIGLISYSLYLWHWPIVVIARYFAFWYGWDPDLKLHKLALLALSFGAAILSWPLRGKAVPAAPLSPRLDRDPVCFGGGNGAAGHCREPGLSAQPALLADAGERGARPGHTLDYRPTNAKRACFLGPKTNDFRFFNQAGCLALSDTKENWLLIGDSQAADLWAGLSRVNPEINLMQGTASGCKPLLLDLPKHRFDVILLSARWGSGNIVEVRKTANALKPFAERVVVLGPRVEYKQDLPWLLAASMLKHDPSVVDRSRLGKQKQTDKLFAEQLRQDGIGYVSLYAALCPEGKCKVTDQDGLPLAFDYGHLTASGSTFVAQQIKRSGAL